MKNKLKYFVFGGLPKKDAEFIYLEFSDILKKILRPLESGDWDNRLENELKFIFSSSRGQLFSKSHQKKIHRLLMKIKIYKESIDNINSCLSSLTKDVLERKNPGYEYDFYGFFKIFANSDKYSLDLETFKRETHYSLVEKDIQLILKKVGMDNIQKFTFIKKELISEIQKLRLSLINSYKQEIILPDARRTILTGINILVIILLGWLSYNLSETNNELIQNQNILQNASHIPNNAELDIYIFKWHYDRDIACFRDDETTDQNKDFQVYVANRGRLASGTFGISLNPFYNLSVEIPYGQERNIDRGNGVGVDSGKTGYAELRLQGFEDTMPSGLINLTFFVDCIFCQPNPVNITKQVCIYSSSPESDCNLNSSLCDV